MMYQATQRIADAFAAADLKHQAQELGPLSFVEAGFNGDNCTFRLRFISLDDDNDVKAMTEDFAKIPAARRDAGCRLMNELNREYKYFKFTMDDNGAVCVQYDFPVTVSEEEVGSIAMEVALRCAKVVDDAYPRIMQVIWGAAE